MTALRRSTAWLDDHAPQVALLTTGVTFILLLLGLYTAAIGAGATCNQTYPGCAGQLSPVGLTLPQFVEWFHRLVAMTVGFVILGNALVLQHAYGTSNAARAGWLALLVLPVQVVLGGTTVTFAGLVEGGYAPLVQALHLFAAIAIFAALVAATAWAYQRDRTLDRGAVRLALAVASLGFLVHLAFARDLLVTYTAAVQIASQTGGLVGFAAVLAALCWTTRSPVDERVRAAAGASVAFYLTETTLTAGLFLITRPVELASYAAAALALVAALAATRALRHGRTDAATPNTAG